MYIPEERYSAKQALNHPYFKELNKQDMQIQAKQSLMNFKYIILLIFFNSPHPNLMGSFNNDSQNNIKSTDETNINSKNKKNAQDKGPFLPNIKVNIYIDGNQKYKNDSDDSDMENKDNIMTYVKLPKIKQDVQKIGMQGKNFINSNGFNGKK